MSKKMLLPVGVVVLIIGVIILLLNPDPATTNLEIARNATNARDAAKAISSNNQPMRGCIPSVCSVVASVYP